MTDTMTIAELDAWYADRLREEAEAEARDAEHKDLAAANFYAAIDAMAAEYPDYADLAEAVDCFQDNAVDTAWERWNDQGRAIAVSRAYCDLREKHGLLSD